MPERGATLTTGRHPHPKSLRSARCAIGLALLVCPLLTGCSRTFWRTQADFDSYNAILQKTRDPRWDLPRVTVEPDPRSRFYDPFDPDTPPLPPDDPSAHLYMHVVNGIPGFKSWHKFGESFSVENPQWIAPFAIEPDEGPTRLLPQVDRTDESSTRNRPLVPTLRDMTLEQAIELANIHSREYQTQIENVYQSALLLTFDRFQFQVRYLGPGGREPSLDLDYNHTRSTSDNLALGAAFGVSQALPTGGQWAAELANNTLWLFSGPNQTNSASILSFSIVQPLLSGAGRQVALANLTQSEREVLYDVRTLARFRKIFFADTVVNGPGGGYLGLLRQEQLVRNQRDNIVQLLTQLERQRALYAVRPAEVRQSLEKMPETLNLPDDLAPRVRYEEDSKELFWNGGMTDAERDALLAASDDPAWRVAVGELAFKIQSEVVTLDVAQLLTRYAQSEQQLLSAEQRLQDLVDQYKLQLGLPTDFQLTLNNRLLLQFRLIDSRLTEAELEVTELVNEWADVNEDDPALAQLQRMTVQVDEAIRQIRDDVFSLVKEDFQRVDEIAPKRLAALEDPVLQEQFESNRARDAMLFRGQVETFEAIAAKQQRIRELLTEEATQEVRTEAFLDLASHREALLRVIAALKAVQAGLRVELIELQDFDMAIEEVTSLAVENRLDLMNARARVMDTRRNMEVAANRLQAVLDLVAEADIRNSGGNKPFDFRGDRSTYGVGVRMTAPLDQILERNAYRETLIAYQRARREYMQLEDEIKLAVRTEWRQLTVLKQNFETARQNLRFAAIQLDLAVEESTVTSQGGAGGRSEGGRNTGLNLLNALNSILGAQNDLINLWVQYEQNRINIFRDMDIMEIDERGLWRDPIYQSLASPADLPPALSEPANDNLQPLLDASGSTVTRSQSPNHEAADHFRGIHSRDDRGLVRLERLDDTVVRSQRIAEGSADGIDATRHVAGDRERARND